MTSWPGSDHRGWPSEIAYFQGFFTLDHLDHLFIKRNRNKYSRRNTQDSFPTNAGLGGPRGPQRIGAQATTNRCTQTRYWREIYDLSHPREFR